MERETKVTLIAGGIFLLMLIVIVVFGLNIKIK
jgi:hypothetical protein